MKRKKRGKTRQEPRGRSEGRRRKRQQRQGGMRRNESTKGNRVLPPRIGDMWRRRFRFQSPDRAGELFRHRPRRLGGERCTRCPGCGGSGGGRETRLTAFFFFSLVSLSRCLLDSMATPPRAREASDPIRLPITPFESSRNTLSTLGKASSRTHPRRNCYRRS